jgi:histidine triad (HIT) family protein
VSAPGCVFCRIVRGEKAADIVLDDELACAFLDHRPLFPGHVLLCPKPHHETLGDLPAEAVGPLFARARLIAVALEAALGADGCFLALNNRVSQSVPHLHVHLVPRRKGDGLRGFFWPRHDYASAEQRTRVREAIAAALARLAARP